MKLNLLELAEKEDFEIVECSFGEIKVYHTPEQMIWGVGLGYERPSQPLIKMKLGTGGIQKRLSKLGDAEHEIWLQEAAKYDNDLADLQLAVRYVNALRDVEYPDLNTMPPIAKRNGIEYPESELLRKKFWLNFTVLSRSDDMTKIQKAMMALNGTLEEAAIDGAKKNSTSESTE